MVDNSINFCHHQIMKAKIFAAIFFLILSFFAYKVYAQDIGLTSIMSQNKIRTCLEGHDLTPPTKGGGRIKPETVAGSAKIRLTGTCEAPNGCEIWQYNKNIRIYELG